MKKILVGLAAIMAFLATSSFAGVGQIGITNPPSATSNVNAGVTTMVLGITNSIFATNVAVFVNGVEVYSLTQGGLLGTNITITLPLLGDNVIVAKGTNTSLGIYAATCTVTRGTVIGSYTNSSRVYHTVSGATTNTYTNSITAIVLDYLTNSATYASSWSNMVQFTGNDEASALGGTRMTMTDAAVDTNMYWYGQKVVLYGGLYTNNINNEPLPLGALLTNAYYTLYGTSGLRVFYQTAGAQTPTECPGLRMGHIAASTTISNRYPLILPAFGANETNDYLLVCWPSRYTAQSYTTGYTVNVSYRVFDASLVQYYETNNSIYTTKTIAVGSASFGGIGMNTAEILLFSTNGSSLAGFITAGSLTRPWWIYSNGRDFMCYTNGTSTVGNYSSNTYIPNYLTK